MTDNVPRLTAAPDRSLVTVDGIITEKDGSYPRRLVLTDNSGSIDVTVPGGCVGSTEANEATHLIGTYAIVTGRREDSDNVLAAAVQLLTAATTGTGTHSADQTWVPLQAVPILAKEPTAEEKITLVLEEQRDLLSSEIGYLHLDQISETTGVTRKTVENTLSRLAKAGTVVRNPDAPGEYGLPLPNPATPTL